MGSKDYFPADMRERRLRALVVDDHPDAAESLARLLRLMGCSATFVTDPAKAIDAAEVMKPEIVFLDIGMPGIDGYELARMFRSRYGDAVRLVAVTAYGEFSDRMKSRDAAIDEHIAKPVAAKTLQAVLATVLSRR